MGLGELTSADFLPYLNQAFLIRRQGGEPLKAELIEVTQLGSEPAGEAPSAGRRPFSIVFRGPREPIYPQQVYEVQHGKIGSLSMFLVPIGPDQEGMRYEAVFA